MEALDACNHKHRRGTVFLAATGIARQQKAWVTNFENAVAALHDAAGRGPGRREGVSSNRAMRRLPPS
ncbi:DUF4113 domain-containing protein [Bosea sp. PAMC 26642]|uniref:DUF4113 domain-containing protein n=1 Tax=Bosea sp. (strain PAMC 26642) TaxID=1792307 RepID=UPI0009EC3E49